MDLRALGNHLDLLQRSHGVPGFSAAVVVQEQLTWSASYGSADRSFRTLATNQTLYDIASVTKTFSSTLILQLVESGDLRLDQFIVRFLPENARLLFEGCDVDAITIRHVLSHTSDAPPGEKYRYDGARFGVLGVVLSQVTGTSLPSLFEERILNPLGMTETVPGLDQDHQKYRDPLSRCAKPYRVDELGKVHGTAYPTQKLSASAGLFSTVEDLAKFDAALDGNMLIGAASQEEAWTPTKSSTGATHPYGLGWFIQNYRDVRLIWHYGWWPDAFSSLLLKVPEYETSLILLANSDGLSQSFDLGAGDVTRSDFASAFLNQLLSEA